MVNIAGEAERWAGYTRGFTQHCSKKDERGAMKREGDNEREVTSRREDEWEKLNIKTTRRLLQVQKQGAPVASFTELEVYG